MGKHTGKKNNVENGRAKGKCYIYILQQVSRFTILWLSKNVLISAPYFMKICIL